MLLELVFKILENAKAENNLIHKVQYSPKRDAIVVDVNYGKALSVCVDKNVVHVQGDTVAGEKVKKIIEGAIQKCQ